MTVHTEQSLFLHSALYLALRFAAAIDHEMVAGCARTAVVLSN